MIKDELIFGWSSSESHRGHKLLAIMLVTGVFTILLGSVNVRFGTERAGAVIGSSVLQFKNDELGTYWRMRAEEEGPFPGRMELLGDNSLPNFHGLSAEIEEGEWTTYQMELSSLQSIVGINGSNPVNEVENFLPELEPLSSASVENIDSTRIAIAEPILIPFDEGSLKWMPDMLPDFSSGLLENAIPATWRFLVRLSPDGNVDQCISLSGTDGPSLGEMTGWLKSVHFKEGVGERWLGLRVEFINRYKNGSDAK